MRMGRNSHRALTHPPTLPGYISIQSAAAHTDCLEMRAVQAASMEIVRALRPRLVSKPEDPMDQLPEDEPCLITAKGGPSELACADCAGSV